MNKNRRLVLLTCLFLALVSQPPAAFAQTGSASDLIAAVNGLRASQGLQAYQTDSWLMSYAQQHANYLASIGYGTHVHSDGSLPWESGIQENVAGGTEGLLTVEIVVYTIWSDWGHWKTMVGHAGGQVGAGMAVSDGMVYYVLNVRPEDSETAASTPGVPISAPYTFVPLLTSTPKADGSIVHLVASGQTLWSIAISYGVKVDDIRLLNGLPGDSTYLYVGQPLLIHPAGWVTPPGTAASTITSPTVIQPTPTRSQTPSPRPPTQTSTPAASSTPLLSPTPPAAWGGGSEGLGLGVLVVILILLVVGVNEYQRKVSR